LNISRVVLADFRSNAEIAAKERRPNLRDEFFHGVPGVGVFLAAEVSVQTSRVTRGMAVFMRKRCPIGLAVAEGLEFRHLHDVAVDTVKGAVAAVPNGDFGIGEKPLGEFEPLDLVGERRLDRIKMTGQPVDLLA
jgi:hypothetical protein